MSEIYKKLPNDIQEVIKIELFLQTTYDTLYKNFGIDSIYEIRWLKFFCFDCLKWWLKTKRFDNTINNICLNNIALITGLYTTEYLIYDIPKHQQLINDICNKLKVNKYHIFFNFVNEVDTPEKIINDLDRYKKHLYHFFYNGIYFKFLK
jgi:hypothetical protein